MTPTQLANFNKRLGAIEGSLSLLAAQVGSLTQAVEQLCVLLAADQEDEQQPGVGLDGQQLGRERLPGAEL